MSKKRNKTTTPTINSSSNQGLWAKIRSWTYDKRYYFLAFFIPSVIVTIAYALFGLYPLDDGTVLVLDLNAQYVYYYEYMRDAFWGDSSILYSWSRNLSGEYMGIVGYYLMSPFNLIMILLPRTMIQESILLMQLAKVGTCGITMMYYLQHSKKIKPINSLVFSTLFAASGYMVTQLMNPMWLDGVILLPLVIIGTEKLIDEGKKLNFIIPLALVFITNYYIGYMIGIFTALYFLYYMFFATESNFKAKQNFQSMLRFAISTIIAIICAAFILLPIYYSLKLGKFDFTTPDFSYKTNFTAQDFFTKLLPSSYDTIRTGGLPTIYCGAISMILVPLYFMSKKISITKRIGGGVLLILLFLSMYVKPVDMAWHGFQVPNWLPFRYSFVFSFLLVVMAAEAFERLKEISITKIVVTSSVILGYIFLVSQMDYEKIDPIKTLLFSVGCIVALAIILILLKKIPKRTLSTTIVLLIILAVELTPNALKTFEDIKADVVYAKHSAYDSVDMTREIAESLYGSDNTFFRMEKTYHKTTNDPAACTMMGISHSSSSMNAKAIKFLGSFGISQRGHYTRYAGASPLFDSIFGIKYILDKPSTSTIAPIYDQYSITDKVEDVDIYRNPYALPLAYMVSSDIESTSAFGTNPFENQNKLISNMLGEDTELFTPIELLSKTPSNLEIVPAGDQTKYESIEGKDCTIDYVIEAQSDGYIFINFLAGYEKNVNLWVSNSFNSETGVFENFESAGTHFETDRYYTKNIGRYEPGTKICVRMTVKKEYVYIRDELFYHMDDEIFRNSMMTLMQYPFNLTKFSDRHIEGTVTAKENQTLFTTIPMEPGWTIKVDGKKVEPVELCNSMIGIQLDSGKHEITMSFFPKGLLVGLILLVVGLAMVVIIYMCENDKKNKITKIFGKFVNKI